MRSFAIEEPGSPVPALYATLTQPIVNLLKNFLLVSGLDMSVTPSLVDLSDVTLATN